MQPYQPSREDLLSCLATRNFMGKTLAARKEIFRPLMDQKEEVKAFLQRCNNGNGERFVKRFQNILPKTQSALNNSNKMQLTQIAKMTYNLYELWEEALEKPPTRLTRGEEDKTKALDKLFSPIKIAVRTAEDKAHLDHIDGLRSAIVTKDVDKDRPFGTNGTIPTDPALQFCQLCGHKSIDAPDSNKMVLQRNKNKMKEHMEATAIFKAQKANGTLPANARAPRVSFICCSLIILSLILTFIPYRTVETRQASDPSMPLPPNALLSRRREWDMP